MKGRVTAGVVRLVSAGYLLLTLAACGGGGGGGDANPPGGGSPPPPPPPPPTVTAPAITSQPASASVTEGDAVAFSVSASGDAPLAYQWMRDGVDIAGASSASYAFNAALTDNGASFTVSVSNSAGSVTSNAATLSVTTPTPVGPERATRDGVIYLRNGDLYLVRTDGTRNQRLTESPEVEQFQAVTADGHIVYLRPVASGGELRSVWPDGSHDVLLYAFPTGVLRFKKALELQVIFEWLVGGGSLDCELFVVNADGTGLIQLDDSVKPVLYEGLSTINGETRVVYRAYPLTDDDNNLFSVRIDGTDTRALADSPDYEQVVGIGPDGRVIYRRLVDGAPASSDAHLYSVPIDGSVAAVELGGGTDTIFGSLLEEGDSYRVVFARDGDLFAVDPDGSDEFPLTGAVSGAARGGHATPDGKVLFELTIGSPPSTNRQLWIVNADGSGPLQLTGNGVAETYRLHSVLPAGWVIHSVTPVAGSTTSLRAVHTDGTGLVTLLTTSQALEFVASSSDGRVIINIPDGSGTSNYYSVNADGTDPRTLIELADFGSWGGLCVDALNHGVERVVFAQRVGSQHDLISFTTDGRNPRLLTDTLDDDLPVGVF